MKVGDLVKDIAFNIGGIGIILKTNRYRNLYEVQFSDGAKRWLCHDNLQKVTICK